VGSAAQNGERGGTWVGNSSSRAESPDVSTAPREKKKKCGSNQGSLLKKKNKKKGKKWDVLLITGSDTSAFHKTELKLIVKRRKDKNECNK